MDATDCEQEEKQGLESQVKEMERKGEELEDDGDDVRLRLCCLIKST